MAAHGKVCAERDEDRGKVTYWGECSMHGCVTVRIEARDLGRDRPMARVTNDVARRLQTHFHDVHGIVEE